MILELDLEALTDISLSASNHTLGLAEMHDHIPGRTLWGALANRAYRGGMSQEDAFRIFHQGSVRILDAVPVLDGERTYPMPGSWHQPKDQPGAPCKNFALENVRKAQGTTQYKGSKGGWIAPSLTQVKYDKNYSLRTAVDPTGKARQGLLHGVPVLQAGCKFWTAVLGSERDCELIKKLVKGSDLRVGRSRNSELGIVRVQIRNSKIKTLSNGTESSKSVSFLCVSRCIFRDSTTGAPTLEPSPESMGLDESWKFDAAASFVRTARIVHFNAKRARPESERFALERGSVLTFRSTNTISLNDVVNAVEQGVGEHRGQGYGEVLVAPLWLTKESFQVKASERSQSKPSPEPTDALFVWAKERSSQRNTTLNLYQAAAKHAEQFREYRVPSSQWGALRTMAREARFRQSKDLFDQIFHDKTGFLATGKRGLSAPWKRSETSLAEICGEQKADLPIFLELLASACMRPSSKTESTNGGGDR